MLAVDVTFEVVATFERQRAMGTLVTTQILVHLADMLWQVAARDPAAALCALQQKAVACVTLFSNSGLKGKLSNS